MEGKREVMIRSSQAGRQAKSDVRVEWDCVCDRTYLSDVGEKEKGTSELLVKQATDTTHELTDVPADDGPMEKRPGRSVDVRRGNIAPRVVDFRQRVVGNWKIRPILVPRQPATR